MALRYRAGQDTAPKVTAKGAGNIAEKIISIAKEHGIPVKDDPDLIEVLTKLDIEEQIPPTIYLVVAELLAFAYSVNKKKRPKQA